MTSAKVVGRRIVVTAPFALKDKLKSIPSRRWDGEIRAWCYPATAGAAYGILHAIPGVEGDEAFRGLVAQAEEGEGIRSDSTASGSPTVRDWPADLRRYQRQGAAFLLARGAAYLPHWMGTGKTRTVIEAVKAGRLKRVLVLCPRTVVPSWEAEWAKWAAPGTFLALRNNRSVVQRAEALARAWALADARGEGLAVAVNYEAAWRVPLGPALLARRWDLVVGDEIHRGKSPGRGDYAAILKKKEGGADARTSGVTSLFLAELAWSADRRVGLSGTPFPNSPLDIWAQLRFVDPGILEASYGSFLVKHAIRGGYAGKQVLALEGLDEINAAFDSVSIKLRPEDALSLPPQTHVDRIAELGEKASKIYREVETSFVATLPEDMGQVSIANALVEVIRLQQICSGHIKLDPEEEGREGKIVQVDTAKEDALREILEDLPEKEPVVVFCKFKESLSAVHRAAKDAGRKSAELSGSRDELEAWKGSAAEVLAIQIQAGGVGIDCSRAAECIFFDEEWSPAVLDQAVCRLHRHGQTRPVTYHHLVAVLADGKPTVDARIRKAVARKEKVIEEVLRSLKNDSEFPTTQGEESI